MPGFIEIGPVVLEKKGFLNIINVCLLFSFNLSLVKDVALHLNKLESLLYKDVLCQIWWNPAN